MNATEFILVLNSLTNNPEIKDRLKKIEIKWKEYNKGEVGFIHLPDINIELYEVQDEWED